MNEQSKTFPTAKLASITPGSSVLDESLNGLYVEASGTMDYTNWDDTTRSAIPIFAGSTLPFRPKKITALGGGAAVSGYYTLGPRF